MNNSSYFAGGWIPVGCVEQKPVVDSSGKAQMQPLLRGSPKDHLLRAWILTKIALPEPDRRANFESCSSTSGQHSTAGNQPKPFTAEDAKKIANDYGAASVTEQKLTLSTAKFRAFRMANRKVCGIFERGTETQRTPRSGKGCNTSFIPPAHALLYQMPAWLRRESTALPGIKRRRRSRR